MIYSCLEGSKTNHTLEFLSFLTALCAGRALTVLISTGIFHKDCSVQKKKIPY